MLVSAMMDTTMVVVSLSVAVLAVSYSILYMTESGASKIAPTTFYQEEAKDERPPKTISVEDSPTVLTAESDQTDDSNGVGEQKELEEEEEEGDKTLVTGTATRECAKITEEAVSSTATGEPSSTPLPKKLRRAARKMLGIQKPAKKAVIAPAPASPAVASEVPEVRVAI